MVDAPSSPTLPSRPVLIIALGVLLLANPLYVDALHLDEPNWYRYESTPVTVSEEGIDVDIHADGIDDDIACLQEPLVTRGCAVEYAILEHGNLTAPVTWGDHIHPGRHGYRYAYLDGRFYEVESTVRNGRTVLSLNRTPTEEAMRYASTPLSHASGPVRTAVETGSVETRHELDGADQLIRDGDDYYVVYRVAGRTYGRTSYLERVRFGRIAERGASLLGVAVGVWLVLRGQRRRVERAWNR